MDRVPDPPRIPDPEPEPPDPTRIDFPSPPGQDFPNPEELPKEPPDRSQV